MKRPRTTRHIDIAEFMRQRTTEELYNLRKSIIGETLVSIDDELKKRGQLTDVHKSTSL